jgi:uncharacterized membrane protein
MGKHFLLVLFCLFSLSTFSQENRKQIEFAIEKQITEVAQSFKTSAETLVIDEINFKPSSNFKLKNFKKSAIGLQDFIRIEVFYSTFEIRYTLVVNGKETKKITKKYNS